MRRHETNRTPVIVDVFFRKFTTTVTTYMINVLEGTVNDWLRFKLHKTDRVDIGQYCGYFALPFSPWERGQMCNKRTSLEKIIN
jgi:hypothetical protein